MEQVKQDLCSEAGILSGLVNLLMDGNELAVTKVTSPARTCREQVTGPSYGDTTP